MSVNNMQQDFMNDVLGGFELIPHRDDIFYVSTGFYFNDGDEFVIYLQRVENKWILSDNGRTYMYLSFTLDQKQIHAGRRGEVINGVLKKYNIIDKNGELTLELSHGRYGEALNDFIQAIQKISNVLYWVQSRPNRTFKQDFSERLNQTLGESRIDLDWYDPQIKGSKQYAVDYRINGLPEPLFAYAITTETKIRDAIIAWRWFEAHNVKFTPFGIFRDNRLMNSKQFPRMIDVCERYEVGINNSARAIDDYVKNLTIVN